MVRLGEIKPRERAGAQTAQRYEFQYQRTARAALNLLDDTQEHVCVYCDWHDDFVIEVGTPPTRYVFHQVKGRTSSKGPWTFPEFFGVQHKKGAKPATKPPAVSGNAIFPLMLLQMAEGSGVSRRTVAKWVQRFRGAGLASLEDAPSRPRRMPAITAAAAVRASGACVSATVCRRGPSVTPSVSHAPPSVPGCVGWALIVTQ